MLTISVLIQSRAFFSNGKAVGIDDNSAEILKSVPWRALQKIRKAFEMTYLGQNREEIETWMRNIIVLIPKKKDDEQIGGGADKVNLCAECRGQVVLRLPLHPARNGAERIGEKGQELGEHPTSLGSKMAEVRRRSPLPSGSWPRQQENGDLSLVSLHAPRM